MLPRLHKFVEASLTSPPRPHDGNLRSTSPPPLDEETGYLVAPRELLAVVRNDFHLYRCELLRSEPLKDHDHEIARVTWLDAAALGGLWGVPMLRRSWLPSRLKARS